MRAFSRFTLLSAFILSFFLLSGCKDKAQPAAKAPEAAYVVINPEVVAVINELSGRLESYRNSDVRARVAGVLEKRLFVEGSDVAQGQELYIIDPRSYEAAVQNAKATLARAEANFMQTDLRYRRYIPLVKIKAVSEQEYDDSLAAQKQAAADVASAKAALVQAKLDLEYSTVLAPISGRIGRTIVTEGALVGQGEVTLLAVIQQIDPIYLNLTQSSAELLQLQQAMRKGQLKGASEDGLKVTLVMEDGTQYSHPGKLLFSDITVDPSTGEISIRALFPNPDHILLPGMYVRGRLEQAINENALTVPKQAVQRATEGSTVFVINKDNVAEVRQVKTGASWHEKWVVLEGLKPGDRVIVEGLQKIRPGAPVTPIPWEKVAKQDTPAQATPNEAEKASATGTEKPLNAPTTPAAPAGTVAKPPVQPPVAEAGKTPAAPSPITMPGKATAAETGNK
ncbi:MAG: efflux RND transporter periplasmic adaptor subunit [Burkholderiaceae bacterium]|nr:efflux RND transporter periplasmic adaptor subunit [Burkholderiaceae bacterium]